MIQSVSKTFTGNGTNYIGSRLRGMIIAVKVVAGAVTAGFDITLTGTDTGVPILLDTSGSESATTWYFTQQLIANGASGGAATDSFTQIPLCTESITCVTANAGTSADITVTVIYDSDE